MSENLEIEVKIKTDADIVPALIKNGYEKKNAKHQIDSYYIVAEDIKGQQSWLRIREDKINNKASFDFHQRVSDFACRETEVDISALGAEKLAYMINTIMHIPKCVVNKKRETYYKNGINVTIDNVLDLGNFVEVEIMGQDTLETQQRLVEVTQSLGLDISKKISHGYPELLMNKGK